MVSINDKIRMLRERNKLSQKEMAIKLNMSSNGYAKLERGETRLYFSKVERIAKIFDINLMELLSYNEDVSINLDEKIASLQLILEHKNEIIQHKDEMITILKRENQILFKLLSQ